MDAVWSQPAEHDTPAPVNNGLRRIMATPDQDNPEWVLQERVRSGDRAAFSAWVQQHQRPLFAVIWRYVRNDEDARDLVQATFVKAWQGLATFRGESSLKTWLYRIGINLALNHKRDNRSNPREEIPDDAASPDATAVARLEEAQQHDRLLAAVQSLPAKQRLVVELRVQQELSFQEVAAVAQSTEDSAKANFHHAIKRLRTLMQEP